ncbi:MAG: tetratricopeptide repeat protein [Candidatus Methylomirabilota bacterium]
MGTCVRGFLFSGLMVLVLAPAGWSGGVCDQTAGDPSFIQADRRAQWLVAARGRVEKPAVAAEASAARAAVRAKAVRPLSFDWAGAESLRAKLSGQKGAAGGTVEAEKYLSDLVRKLEELEDRSGERGDAAYQLGSATLVEHAGFLAGWLVERVPGTELALRAGCVELLAGYAWSGDKEVLLRGLRGLTASARARKAEELAGRVLLGEASRETCGAELREVLAGTVVKELDGTASAAGARMLLGRVLESDGREAAAEVYYREVVDGQTWSEWGPRAALRVGALEVKRGGETGAAALGKLATTYGTEALRAHAAELTPQALAEARDAGAWAQYHAGYLLLQAGKKAEAVAALRKTVDSYPGTGYAKAAQGVLERVTP